MKYSERGELLVRATVVHPTARRCGAFSVAAHIDEYTIKDANSYRFHAVVHKARLGDISCVETPINSFALVTNRWKSPPLGSPMTEFYSLMQRRVGVLIKMTEALATRSAA